jgi:hypothetical protein
VLPEGNMQALSASSFGELIVYLVEFQEKINSLGLANKSLSLSELPKSRKKCRYSNGGSEQRCVANDFAQSSLPCAGRFDA